MPSRFDDVYKAGKDDTLSPAWFDTRFRDLDDRLTKLEALDISWEAALAQVQDAVLSRSEDVIASLRDKLVALTGLNWLVGASTTSATLTLGSDVSVVVTADVRDLFTPGPYLLLSRQSTPDDYAVAQLLGYDRETGQLDVHIEAVWGNPGPHADWVIASLSGATTAQRLLLLQGQAAQAAAEGAADATAADRAAVHADRLATDADAAATAADRVQTGLDRAAAHDSASTAAASAAAAGGKLTPKGMWNAATNSPPLVNGVGSEGDRYIVSVAGMSALDGHASWAAGDWAIFTGGAWHKLQGQDNAVLSVANKAGAVLLTASDIAGLRARQFLTSLYL